MIFTTKMKQLVAVVLDHDVEKVTEELLRQGIIHFVSITEFFDEQKSKIDSVTPQISQGHFSETIRRIESFLQLSGSLQDFNTLDLKGRNPVNLEETDRILNDIGSELQVIQDRQNIIQKEIMKLENISRQVTMFGDINIGIIAPAKHSFITIQAGTIQTSMLDAFTSDINVIPSVKLNLKEEDERTSIVLITMKRDNVPVNKILDNYGWVDIELSEEIGGPGEDALKDLGSKRTILHNEQEKLNADIHEIIEKKREMLENMRVNLKINELFYKIQSYFGTTSRTKLFSGWLPASNQKTLEKAIGNITSGQCYLEWNDPVKLKNLGYKNVNVPVQLKNPRFLSPFQMLVQNFSIPEYGTIDPTLFLAIAYLIMYGLMFCDLGHGAVLVLVGSIGSIIFKDTKESYYNISKLIIWCGASAIITGALFGAYFGTEWLKPLWFDYPGIISGHIIEKGFVKDINGILSMTIYFGIFIVSFGLILNWINKIAQRNWLGLILDKGGLLGGWIYGAGVYTAIYYIHHGYTALPSTNKLFWLLGLPSIILLLNPLMKFLPLRKKDTNLKFTIFTPFELCLTWAVELLDIFSGFLSNTLSFMRIAGYGIAHISLMAVIFDFARTVGDDNSSYTVWSYIILIIGNLLVISLEGLLAGVQSLRLNYYEFFTKFFSGRGKAYSPISLSSRV